MLKTLNPYNFWPVQVWKAKRIPLDSSKLTMKMLSRYSNSNYSKIIYHRPLVMPKQSQFTVYLYKILKQIEALEDVPAVLQGQETCVWKHRLASWRRNRTRVHPLDILARQRHALCDRNMHQATQAVQWVWPAKLCYTRDQVGTAGESEGIGQLDFWRVRTEIKVDQWHKQRRVCESEAGLWLVEDKAHRDLW